MDWISLGEEGRLQSLGMIWSLQFDDTFDLHLIDRLVKPSSLVVNLDQEDDC